MQGASGSNASQLLGDQDVSVPSLQVPHAEIRDGVHQQLDPGAATLGLQSREETLEDALRCDDCGLTFPKPHLFK